MGQDASSLFYPILGQYVADSSATQEEVCDGLYKDLVAALAQWAPTRPVFAERTISAAGAATTDTVAITQYSNAISGATTIAGAAAVGDYVRIGSQSTVTDEVYQIIAINGTTLTLDTPIQGPSIASVAIYRVVQATAQAGNWGIRITGIQQPWKLDSRGYGVNVFQVGIAINSNAGTTRRATSTEPYRGNGNYQQVTESEVTFWRNQGQMYSYTEFPPVQPTYTTVVGQNYSTLNITWKKTVDHVNISPFKGNIMVACALDGNVAHTFKTNYTGVATSAVDVLDAFMSLNPALSPQVGNL
jgi:hypothetical protein